MADQKLSWFDYSERTLKAVAVVAIPVVVAIVGNSMDQTARQSEMRLQYVRLATGILAQKDAGPDLRSWAVEVLNTNSQIHLPKTTYRQLVTGKLTLPQDPDAHRLQVLQQSLYQAIGAQLRDARSAPTPAPHR